MTSPDRRMNFARFTVFRLAWMLLFLGIAQAAWAGHAGRILVVWNESVETPPDPGLLGRLSTVTGVELTWMRDISGRISLLRWVSAGDIGEAQVLERMEADSAVSAVQAERQRRLQFVPTDPFYTDQWYLYESVGIEAPSAWDLQRGSPAVVVATLDTGILSHADLNAARVLPGYDFISDVAFSNDGDGRDPDPTDPGDAVVAGECGVGEPAEDSSWHGLAVAGVILATEDNLIGVSGIDHGARLLPVRVFGKCGALFSDILDALRWAAGLVVTGVPANPNPAHVINLSFGGAGACGPVEQAVINEVIAAGAVLVAAAGNEGGDVALVSPASCAGVIAVAAVTRSGALAAFSNTGEEVAISAAAGDGGAAPGVLSLWNTGTTAAAGDTYAFFQGTSFSAAQVSGVAALMRAEQPSASPSQVLQALRAGAKPFPDASCNASLCGAGLLDAYAALQATMQLSASNTTDTGGGGGGGCTRRVSGTPDPLWLAGLAWIWWRTRRGNDPS